MTARIPTVLVHGGVDMDSSPATMDALARAGAAGLAAFADGGSVAAVTAAVSVLEADPRFNAGLGSVFNADGDVECDAGINEGATGRFVGVGALTQTLHPVQVAASLLREQRNLLLVGAGAAAYARSIGQPVAELRTAEQQRVWAQFRRSDGRSPFTGRIPSETVGALAIDADGAVVAASSTGGLLHKRVGRVGDSAILGAGLYATVGGGAVCSGVGEAAVELGLARFTVEKLSVMPVADAVRAAIERAWQQLQARTAVLAYDAGIDTFAAAHSGSEFPALHCTAEGYEAVVPTAVARSG